MTPAEFQPLIPKAIGKSAADWEIDRAFAALEPYPAWAVVQVLAPLKDVPALRDLVLMVSNRVTVRASRERALNPETCEHNRIDVPYDPCPECRPKYAAAAKAGADLCRASLSAQSGVLS